MSEDIYVHMMDDRSKNGGRRKDGLSFQARLARDLKRFNKHHNIHERAALPYITPKQCRLLALPKEIRQAILDSVLDDEVLRTANLAEEGRTLSLVCQTFKADMIWVLKQWQQRKKALAVIPNGAFDSYIADLMAPILSAGRAKSSINKLPGIGSRDYSQHRASKHYEQVRKDRKIQSSLRGRRDLRGAPDGLSERWRVPSAEEAEDKKMWRQLRDDQIKKTKVAMADKAREEQLAAELRNKEDKLARKREMKRFSKERRKVER